MVVHHLFAVLEFVSVHAEDKEVVQTALGQIHVFQVCHIVYVLDVMVQVQVETM
jgi:hypothetical protein